MILHNIGIIDSLLLINMSENIPTNVKYQLTSLLSSLFKDENLLKEIKNDPKKLITSTLNILKDLNKININSEEDIIYLKKGLEIAEISSLNEETLNFFVKSEGIKQIMNLMDKNKGNPQILTLLSASLSILANNNKIAEEINEFEGNKLIANAIINFPNLLELLRTLALQTGKIATSYKAKSQIAEDNTPKQLILALKQFNEDLVLSINVCFAFSQICYKHPENSLIMLHSDFIEITKILVKKFIDQGELINNICLFYYCVTFVNFDVLEKINSEGIIYMFIFIFNEYSKRGNENNENKAIFQCLK